MDVTQAILLSAIVVLTLFLVIIAFQVFFVLKDLKVTLKKVNKFLDTSDDLIAEAKKPVSSIANIVTALTAGAGIVHLVKRLEGKKDEREK